MINIEPKAYDYDFKICGNTSSDSQITTKMIQQAITIASEILFKISCTDKNESNSATQLKIIMFFLHFINLTIMRLITAKLQFHRRKSFLKE